MRKWERRNLGSKVKLTCLKAVEVIGTRASTMASNAKQKVAEINVEARRQDILSQFTLLAYDLWQNGTELPEQLDSMLRELAELDERLSVLRAQRYMSTAEDSGAREAQPEDGENAEPVADDALPPAETYAFDAMTALMTEAEQPLPESPEAEASAPDRTDATDAPNAREDGDSPIAPL